VVTIASKKEVAMSRKKNTPPSPPTSPSQSIQNNLKNSTDVTSTEKVIGVKKK